MDKEIYSDDNDEVNQPDPKINLYIGSLWASRNENELRSKNISAILCVAFECVNQKPNWIDDNDYFHIEMEDSSDYDLFKDIEPSFNFIHTKLKEGKVY